MEARAVSKYVGNSVKKTQIPVNIVRGMKASEAMDILKYMPKAAAHVVRKAVGSAIANAVNNKKMDVNALYITEIRVDRGPSQRRIIFKGKGGYAFFNRPSSHITVILGDRMEKEVKVKGASAKGKKGKNAKKDSESVKAVEAESTTKTKKQPAKSVKKTSVKKGKE